MINKKTLTELSIRRAVERRKVNLKFLRSLIQSGRALSISDGDRFMTMINLYPLETWYLCRALNPEFYKFVGEMIEANIQEIEETLN